MTHTLYIMCRVSIDYTCISTYLLFHIHHQHPTSVSPLHALRADFAQKEFQLEELEDKEECETEVWLNEDGTISLGATNGPPVKAYQGDWHLIETASDSDQPFRMRLTRQYEVGR